MTDADFIALCERITYKPGWQIIARRQLREDGVELTVGFAAADADGQRPGYQPVIGSYMLTSELLGRINVSLAIDIIRRHIVSLEMHELDEWLRVAGQRVREPHPKRLGRAG